MKTKIPFVCLPLIALALFTLACDKAGNPAVPTEKTCSELGDSLAVAAGASPAAYKVIRPNGGETYRVGDSLHVRATGNINAANASLYLQIGTRLVRPASLSGNLNVYGNCDMVFVIPDSLQTIFAPVMMISLVSDSVKVRVESYSDNSRRDLSDAFFRIQARATP
jgi:hypothetical protein